MLVVAVNGRFFIFFPKIYIQIKLLPCFYQRKINKNNKLFLRRVGSQPFINENANENTTGNVRGTTCCFYNFPLVNSADKGAILSLYISLERKGYTCTEIPRQSTREYPRSSSTILISIFLN